MAKQTVESTDNLNEGRTKINENFTELYDTPIKSGTLTENVTLTGTTQTFTIIGNSTSFGFNPNAAEENYWIYNDGNNVGGFDMYTYPILFSSDLTGIHGGCEISLQSNGTAQIELLSTNSDSSASCQILITPTYININIGSDATGDMYYRNSTGEFTRLPIGSEGQILKVVSGLPAWVNP